MAGARGVAAKRHRSMRLLALILTAVSLAAWPVAAASLRIKANPVPLTFNDPTLTRTGKLEFLTGLVLSSDHPKFGGLSGLAVSDDGTRLLAIGDRGVWVTASIEHRNGLPTGLTDAEISPILNMGGQPLTGDFADAEGLIVDEHDGRFVRATVSFEREARLGKYDLGKEGFLARPTDIPLPAEPVPPRYNKGVEGITELEGGLLAMTEQTLDPNGNIAGWIGGLPLTLRKIGSYHLTDLDTLPDGRLLTLERHYTRGGGPGMRMRLIDPITVKPGAILGGEIIIDLNAGFSIDNMEGLTSRRAPDGSTWIYVVSDDNFNAVQRTLLLVFRLMPAK